MWAPDHTHPDEVICRIARRQAGVAALLQLLAAGLTARQVEARIETGHLHIQQQGVYSVGHPLLTREARRWAAVLACGRGGAVSHWSNAVHRGLLKGEDLVIEVTVPTGRLIERPAVKVRRAALVSHEVEEVRGLSCTSVPRMLLELAASRPSSAVERAWRQAVYARVLEMTDIEELLIRRRGERGTVLLRSLYERRTEIIGRLNGDTEVLLLPIIRESFLGEPRVNEPVWVGRRSVTVDFYFPSLRLAIEGDSRLAHADPEAEAEDARRDAELQAIGIHVHRFTWDEARWRRHHVLTTLNALANR